MLSASNGKRTANFSDRTLHDAFRPPFGTLASNRFRPAGCGVDPAGCPAGVGQEEERRAASERSAAGTDNETPKAGDGDDEKPAAQANDEEKPKASLNLEQEAPKTDSLGHVHFASPNGEGLGAWW